MIPSQGAALPERSEGVSSSPSSKPAPQGEGEAPAKRVDLAGVIDEMEMAKYGAHPAVVANWARRLRAANLEAVDALEAAFLALDRYGAGKGEAMPLLPAWKAARDCLVKVGRVK